MLYLPCQLDSSGWYAKAANELSIRIHDGKGQREAMHNLGRYYTLRPHNYLAFLFYDNALTASRAAGDSTGVVLSLLNMGNCYQYQGQHAEAQRFVNRALKVAWKSGLDSLRAWVLTQYYIINNADSNLQVIARKALQQAMAIHQRYHSQMGLLYTRLFKAHEALLAGQTAMAEQILHEVIPAADSAGFNYISMYACVQLAGYHSWQQQPDSLQLRRKAVEYAVAGGYAGLLLPVVNGLYDWCIQHHQSADAAKYSRIALQIIQQQQEDLQAGEADYLSYTFGNEWMDSLRQEHQSQSRLLQHNITTNRFWYLQLALITAIALLLATLLMYFIRAYRLSHMNVASMAILREEIGKGNLVLQDSDDFKNKLISVIAHDFRTPLHNIVNITGFIDGKTLTVPEAAEMIVEVEQTASATLKMFEDILKWIRTQLSGFTYHPESLLLSAMISTAEQSQHRDLIAKGIRLRIDIPVGTTVLADYEMLQFVHRNFLHNAIKFSPGNSTITISAIRKNNGIMVAFSDEGPGIDAMVLPKLFAWSRKAYEQERSSKGAGLALIICKDFMDKMKGKIWAENNAQRGSTFYYQLPDAQPTVHQP
ncbi:ATP-binding protein [Chitinophaga sp. 30R24]|uniref:ATP-binding protein n=1 Tax=Chitinophaga sp. 30R24 TaxID=3248838 RepID=UPI003B985FCA